jgi:hypothetical protein
LLTFAEESDLLISPINLKVIQDVCDELNKNLILQIIQNSNGVRNAKIAGSVITESPSDVDEELWLAAENQKRERKDLLESALKGKTKETKEAIKGLEQAQETVLQDSEYQKRVQEVIEKAKNLSNKEKTQIVNEDGVLFAVGEEIGGVPSEGKRNDSNVLIGKNFNNIANLREVQGDGARNIPENKKKEKKIKEPKDKKKIKKKIIIFSIILFLSLILAGVFAYLTMPIVQAEIYIESKAIEVEKTLKGDTSINSFSISEGTIPIKKEEIRIDRSDDEATTGKGKRGTKTEGTVILKHWEGEEVTIPAGTILSVEGLDLNFRLR